MAANPSKLNPGFAAQRESLGQAGLLVDVVEIEDVIGNVDKVYVEDCKELSRKVAKPLAAALAKAGYAVDEGRTASLGQVIDPGATFKILGTWKRDHQAATREESKPVSAALESRRKAAEAAAAAAGRRDDLQVRRRRPATGRAAVDGRAV